MGAPPSADSQSLAVPAVVHAKPSTGETSGNRVAHSDALEEPQEEEEGYPDRANYGDAEWAALVEDATHFCQWFIPVIEESLANTPEVRLAHIHSQSL